MECGDLGERALISPAVVAAVEAGQEARAANLMVLQPALETAGIEFIADNGGGPGARLKGQKAKRR